MKKGVGNIMEIDPTSPDFFVKLVEMYQKELVIPYKSGEELFTALNKIYSFETLGYDEAVHELGSFIYDKGIIREKSLTYLLKLNSSSEIFYKYHTSRFQGQNKIVLLINEENEEFICNDHLFQTKINILRGINKEDVDNFTQAFKIYLNLFYLYDVALKKNNLQDNYE